MTLSPEERRKFSCGSTASDDADIESLLRGEKSLGALLHGSLRSRGFEVDVVPSPAVTGPGQHSFFEGGESIRRHSHAGLGIDAVQIESPRSLRAAGARDLYAEALAEALLAFLHHHFEEDGGSNLETD